MIRTLDSKYSIYSWEEKGESLFIALSIRKINISIIPDLLYSEDSISICFDIGINCVRNFIQIV